VSTSANVGHEFLTMGFKESPAQVQLKDQLEKHEVVPYVWARRANDSLNPINIALSNFLLLAGLRYTKAVNLSIFYDHPLVKLLLGTHKGSISELSTPYYRHIVKATAVGPQHGLNASQIMMVNTVINGRTIYGIVETGPGTGKSFTAAKAFGTRAWEKRQATRFGKPLVLILGETNRAVFDLTKAMYREGVRMRYACSSDAFFFTAESGEGGVLKMMRDVGFVLEGWTGENEDKIIKGGWNTTLTPNSTCWPLR
jgi:hypothetical protein